MWKHRQKQQLLRYNLGEAYTLNCENHANLLKLGASGTSIHRGGILTSFQFFVLNLHIVYWISLKLDLHQKHVKLLI